MIHSTKCFETIGLSSGWLPEPTKGRMACPRIMEDPTSYNKANNSSFH